MTDIDDLLDQLESKAEGIHSAAIALIKKQQAEIDRLREALREIMQNPVRRIEIARDALGEKDD